uniref:Mitochondrial import inner membrane translocase subunit TIM50 n=1 Tax=Caenorhabditis tropicalis TaxID=1561998 RepID=A0A1I7U715_9PELO
MSLSKLSQTYFSRHQAKTFIRFSSSDFKSLLGPPAVANPYADNGRTRFAAPIIPINHGNVFASIKVPISKTPEAIAYKPAVEEAPKLERIEPETPKIEAEKVMSSPAPNPVSAPSAIEELNSLKDSLGKLEEATASKTSSSSGGSDNNDHPGNPDEVEARRKRMERNTRIGAYVLFGGSIVGFISFCFYYGRAQRDEAGNVIADEFSGSFLAPFYRIASSFKLWRDYVVEPAREQLLPDPLPAPYLQPKYTIVIELKNILVHPEWTYKTGYRFLKRPALDYFLDVIGYPNFEVVIYSSESMMTAAPVVDSFDPKQRIMYKLFRDCTKYMNGHHVKDLSKLNRDLSKVIYIDFDAKSGQLNPENMLRVPEWRGNMDDTSLVDLAELLKTIHLSDAEDVRPMLQYYSQYDDPAKEFRRRAVYLAQQEEQKKQQPDESSMLKRYSGRLFGFRRHASA